MSQKSNKLKQLILLAIKETIMTFKYIISLKFSVFEIF